MTMIRALLLLSVLFGFAFGVCNDQVPIPNSNNWHTCYHSYTETCGDFCCCEVGSQADVAGYCYPCPSIDPSEPDDKCRFSERREVQNYILMPGLGYNIFEGSPLSGKERGTTGFSIFEVPTHKIRKTSTELDENGCPQWAWLFPNDPFWSFTRSDGFTSTSTSSAIYSEQTFKKESSIHAQETADSGVVLTEGLDIKFTASQDFARSSSTFSSQNWVEIRTKREATSIKTGVQIDRATVSNVFWAKLADGIKRQDFSLMISEYGTHVIQEIIGGSRLEQILSFSAQNYEEASSDKTAFSEGLTASYEGATGSIGSEQTKKQSQANSINRMSTSSSLYIRGGNGQVTLKGQGEVSKFINDAYLFPAPMDMKLFPIDVFICDLKWDKFQEYLQRNKPDLQVECADIQKLYKDQMEKICEGTPNGCRTKNNPIFPKNWVNCATEDNDKPQTCQCNGEVRYGKSSDRGENWVYRKVTSGIECTNNAFQEDPDYGNKKECQCNHFKENDAYNRRCGKDKDDATSRCGNLCNGDSSCLNGEKCFSQLPSTCPGQSLPRRLLQAFDVES